MPIFVSNLDNCPIIQTSEMGKGPKIPVLEEFIQEYLEFARKYCETAPVGHIETEVLNTFFREIVDGSRED